MIMLTRLNSAERNDFLERIAATAIANQAFLKCSVSGRTFTPENVVFFVGDFLDPDEPYTQDLVEKISNAIDEIFAARSAGPAGAFSAH
jgi:hypothetical protein